MADALAELIAGYPVVIHQPVVWGEMDFYRHVNNTVYFRYFENVRLEFRNGKIIKATANNTKRLNEILDTDAGARYVGEQPDRPLLDTL